jgi:dGTPase
VHETVRRMVNALVSDVIRCSGDHLLAAAPANIDAVRLHPHAIIGMTDAMRANHVELKQFLNEHVYRHQRVLRMTTKAKRVLSALFSAFMEEIKLMPAEHRDQAQRAEQRDGIAGRARTVADYVAGMTDRYAILEYRRLFDPAERT